jgi:hypothetical protein
MNIFVLDTNHTQNAQYHVNTHVVKMPTEAAQMLSTVLRNMGIDTGFKITHAHHPCTKWAQESLENWCWLRDYGLSLEEEWRFRYGHASTKVHKSCEVIRSLPTPNLPSKGLTAFAQAMFDVCRRDSTIEAYRLFYKNFKNHLANWGKRGEPVWWKETPCITTKTAQT